MWTYSFTWALAEREATRERSICVRHAHKRDSLHFQAGFIPQTNHEHVIRLFPTQAKLMVASQTRRATASHRATCTENPAALFSDFENRLTCHFSWYCCDRKSRAAYAQSFVLWQQATIEFTSHDHFLGTPVIMFNRSHVNIGRASTPRSLFYCLFVPHICMVLFFTHIPFVVNHTINAALPERLQQW